MNALHYKHVLTTVTPATFEDAETFKIGDSIHRKRASGFYMNEETTEEQAATIEFAAETGLRIRVHYGDVVTGEDWGDVFDVTGRVGRSTGPCASPLLIANSRSTGGGSILTQCLVKVTTSAKTDQRILLRHPSYHVKAS